MTRIGYEQALARAERDNRTLGEVFLARARRRPRLIAVQDAGGSMSRIRLAAVAQVIPKLLGLADDERAVGVMLPPGRGGTLVNLALALDGRTAVNLNHTAGAFQIARMCEMAEIRTIVSSHLYLEKIGSPILNPRVIHAEDLVKNVDKKSVLKAMAGTILLPPRRRNGSDPDDVVTIIFSSGTTGDPKGIQLSHRQVIAHVEAVATHLELPQDEGCLLSPLPLFHSFGIVPGVWMPLLHGLKIAGQPSPFDAESLGELAEASQATILVSTPTFARGYLKRIPPERLQSLHFAVVGAERCPIDLHAAFKERFGIPLLEGYGCTELAPAISINTIGANRPGSVGRPLPGVEVFTMDPDTGQLLPPGETGLIVVRSPARMVGYLGRPDLTEEVFVHGGYNTGDIGSVDDEGFVHLTGRLARFAKLGGEMVPLDTIESALQSVVDKHISSGRGSVSEDEAASSCQIAVAAVDDRRKGERVVVLFTGELPTEASELVAQALDDLPTLWRPRAGDFHQIESIPILGTGKRDLGAIKLLAAEVSPGAAARIAAGAHEVAESARELAGSARDAAEHAYERGAAAVSDSVSRLSKRIRSGDAEPPEGVSQVDTDGAETGASLEGEPSSGDSGTDGSVTGDSGTDESGAGEADKDIV